MKLNYTKKKKYLIMWRQIIKYSNERTQIEENCTNLLVLLEYSRFLVVNSNSTKHPYIEKFWTYFKKQLEACLLNSIHFSISKIGNIDTERCSEYFWTEFWNHILTQPSREYGTQNTESVYLELKIYTLQYILWIE